MSADPAVTPRNGLAGRETSRTGVRRESDAAVALGVAMIVGAVELAALIAALVILLS